MNVTFPIRLPHETLKKASVEETVLTNFVEHFLWNSDDKWVTSDRTTSESSLVLHPASALSHKADGARMDRPVSLWEWENGQRGSRLRLQLTKLARATHD
jgi:hypothetical protein